MPSPHFHRVTLAVFDIGLGFGVDNGRRATLQRVDPSHRLVAWRGRLLLERPTSAPGPAQGTSDHWWRRPLTIGSFSGAEDGIDFGDQRRYGWVEALG